MHQIRHILDACLILVMIIMGVYLYTTFHESKLIGKTSTIIDFDYNNSPLNTKGQALFQQHCGSCHSLNRILSAPALADVHKRGPWNEPENLVQWIKNPALFIPKTQYTIDLQKQYNGMVMPSFGYLNEEEIKEIIRYITNEEISLLPPVHN